MGSMIKNQEQMHCALGYSYSMVSKVGVSIVGEIPVR